MSISSDFLLRVGPTCHLFARMFLRGLAAFLARWRCRYYSNVMMWASLDSVNVLASQLTVDSVDLVPLCVICMPRVAGLMSPVEVISLVSICDRWHGQLSARRPYIFSWRPRDIACLCSIIVTVQHGRPAVCSVGGDELRVLGLWGVTFPSGDSGEADVYLSLRVWILCLMCKQFCRLAN